MKYTVTETFPSLDQETRTVVNTTVAAFHLNRRPQTLRAWACVENPAIRPLRINGRLAWPVKELRRMLGCSPFIRSTQTQENSLEQAVALHSGEQA